MAQVLNTMAKIIEGKYKQFNPSNPDHQEAYYMLRYQAKQHPEHRFHLEEPFLDVVSMMSAKIAEHSLKSSKKFAKSSFHMKGY